MGFLESIGFNRESPEEKAAKEMLAAKTKQLEELKARRGVLLENTKPGDHMNEKDLATIEGNISYLEKELGLNKEQKTEN